MCQIRPTIKSLPLINSNVRARLTYVDSIVIKKNTMFATYLVELWSTDCSTNL